MNLVFVEISVDIDLTIMKPLSEKLWFQNSTKSIGVGVILKILNSNSVV